jgi:dTDP-4-dehydrorhamnose reductase
MHVLVIGSRGQLGSALCRLYQTQDSVQLTAWTRPEHDITAPAISQHIAALAPDLVINTAAWTDVDGAESQPDAAHAVNALGPLYIAEGCRRCGAALVQVSTNEVFAGAPGVFYREYDLPAPAGVYARSKLAGERAVHHAWTDVYIVRTAWVFGAAERDFPSKIVAAADKHGALRVVNDEFGNPSYAPDIAAAIAQLVQTERYGVYHLVNQGRASRFEWARAVLDASGRRDIPVAPIAHSEWPRPAAPPLHAVLVNQAAAALSIEMRPWQQALHEYLAKSAAPDTNRK